MTSACCRVVQAAGGETFCRATQSNGKSLHSWMLASECRVAAVAVMLGLQANWRRSANCCSNPTDRATTQHACRTACLFQGAAAWHHFCGKHVGEVSFGCSMRCLHVKRQLVAWKGMCLRHLTHVATPLRSPRTIASDHAASYPRAWHQMNTLSIHTHGQSHIQYPPTVSTHRGASRHSHKSHTTMDAGKAVNQV